MSESELVYLLVGITIGLVLGGMIFTAFTARAFTKLWRES